MNELWPMASSEEDKKVVTFLYAKTRIFGTNVSLKTFQKRDGKPRWSEDPSVED